MNHFLLQNNLLNEEAIILKMASQTHRFFQEIIKEENDEHTSDQDIISFSFNG